MWHITPNPDLEETAKAKKAAAFRRLGNQVESSPGLLSIGTRRDFEIHQDSDTCLSVEDEDQN